jgi:hypothetical protein
MTRLKNLARTGLLLAATGCYSYTPVQSPQPGADVRARLNAQAAVARSEGLDDAVLAYSGRVLAATPESITLDLLIARDPSQFSRVEIRDTLTLQRSELQSLMMREVSVTRSLLFAGAVGLGAYAIIRGIGGLVGGNEGEPDPGNPALVPLRSAQPTRRGFSLRLSFP